MPHPFAHPRARRPLRAALVGTAAAALAVVLGPGAASAAVQLGSLTKVSDGDPFAGCNADKVAEQPGTLYPNTEIEPWVAADPTDPKDMLAGWQQDRWSNGGSRGLVAGPSRNGGVSWGRSCPRPGHEVPGRPLDPRVGPVGRHLAKGVAYFLHLAFEPDLPSGAFGASAMLVARSTDGGGTWGKPITLIRDTPGRSSTTRTRSPPTRRTRSSPTRSGTG